jgi:hypothetical protein
MHKLRLTIHAAALIAVIVGLPAVIQAQSTRTWVSGTGDDLNTCSRTSPCRTFAGALSKTATNGEINCLNPGSYNFVTITKSITIDCEDTQGALLASGVNGIVVDLGPASASDPLRIVRLRGIALNGLGSGTARGINILSTNTSPVTVHLDNVVIDNFVRDGIFFNAAGGELLVRNSVVQNCANKDIIPIPSGLFVDSSTAAIVHVTVENSTFARNAQGIRGETAARISIYNCNISHNTLNGVVAFNTDATESQINVYKSVIAHNKQWGVVSSGGPGPAIVRLDANHIVSNLGAAQAAGVQILTNGQVLSRGNNTISGNPVDVQGGSLGSLPSL